MSECLHCSQSAEEHSQSAESTMTDLLMMQMLMKKVDTEYRDLIERIVLDWRTHALPVCNPLAIS